MEDMSAIIVVIVFLIASMAVAWINHKRRD